MIARRIDSMPSRAGEQRALEWDVDFAETEGLPRPQPFRNASI
jgi:hypothetical protein